MQVLEKVAKAVSRNYGINLVFKGTQAMTDGKTIYLPSLPPEIDENDEMKVRGYCDHEVSHLLETEIELFKRVGKEGGKTLFDVTNLIEDLRCERLMGKKYPGAKVNMQKTAQMLHNENVKKYGMSKTCEHILAKVWIEGRRHNCGYEIDAPDMTAMIKKTFGADFFDRLRKLKSTQDSMELAQEMIKKATEPWEMPRDFEFGESEDKCEGGSGTEREVQKSKSTEKDKDADADKGDEADGDTDKSDDGESSKGADSDGESEGASDSDADEGDEGEGADSDDEDDDDERSKGGEGTDSDDDSDSGESDGDGIDAEDGDGGDPSDGGEESGSGGGKKPSGDSNDGTEEMDGTDNGWEPTDLGGFKDSYDELKDEFEKKHKGCFKKRRIHGV